jgi:hypothetical protein
MKIILVLIFFVSVALTGIAQSYSIDWFTIDGGGGTSTGGVYSVSGTIGQVDAGTMIGDNFSIDGGFWGIIAAIQTLGAPVLTITRSTSFVIVSWPSPSTGFTLQENADLNTTNWIVAPQTVADDGTNRFIIVNPPVGNFFYRLFKP